MRGALLCIRQGRQQLLCGGGRLAGWQLKDRLAWPKGALLHLLHGRRLTCIGSLPSLQLLPRLLASKYRVQHLL